MLTKISLILCAAFAIVLFGCSKTETNNSNATANSNKATTALAAPAGPATAASTGEKIGVPECDEFIAAYDACVSGKVPEVARAQYKTAVEQWRSSWKKLADNPQTKGSLAAACKQIADQQRTALKSYNCTW